MHIHGNLMNPNLASIYSAAATEKAASAQRAAEVRKKLIGSTSSSDGELDSEETLVRQWSEESSHKRQGQNQSSAPKEDQIADEEQADEPKVQVADEEQADEPKVQVADEEQADEPKIQVADEEQADEPISTWV